MTEVSTPTKERIVDAALVAFATRGYEATSLDQLAQTLELRKQTILYWYATKEVLLEAVIERGAAELTAALLAALVDDGDPFERIERVVRKVFRIGARRPELLGLLRECSRLGPPAATQLAASLSPLIDRAAGFLEFEMAAGRLRRSDPRFLLLAMYSVVLGMVTEVEVLKTFGVENNARSLVQRRRDVLDLLRAALVVEA